MVRSWLPRVEFDSNPDDPRHGTLNGYNNLGCRCERCRAAGSESNRRLRLKRLAGPTPERVHGTTNGYENYGCRCDACRAAYSDAHCRGLSRGRLREVTFEMYSDYRAGMTIEGLARKYGIDRGTVYDRFRKAELPLQRHHRRPTSAMYFDYCTGLSMAEVASKWGVSTETVRLRFQEAGLALRRRPKKEKKPRRPYTGVVNIEPLIAGNAARTARAAEVHADAWRAALRVCPSGRTAELIRLRLEHPDWSLSRLGEEMHPPLTKDSVAGLLRRARELGRASMAVAS